MYHSNLFKHSFHVLLIIKIDLTIFQNGNVSRLEELLNACLTQVLKGLSIQMQKTARRGVNLFNYSLHGLLVVVTMTMVEENN